MFHALFDGPDSGAQIYGAQSIPDPPDRSAFNQRGGSGIDNNIGAHLDGPRKGA
jgi:hypothetical protein